MKKFILILSIAILQSCTSSYIGSRVNMADSAVCPCYKLPKTCEWEDNNFKISARISRLEGKNEFIIDGTVTYIGSATWEAFKQANFTLFLINYGKIVDTVNIQGGQGSLGKTIKFKRAFTTEKEFIASLFSYQMNVRG
ncbi:hypothetical protein [Desulfospira joergensenii]|uniref:hypothetical protein n=1 Tax=Desulfospira joergensenii TaxID=53329 RepID=UPI0012946ED0|nr:hypothetical protein [Desulfospira joergensenii]